MKGFNKTLPRLSFSRWRLYALALLLQGFLCVFAALVWELRTSYLQARFFSAISKQLNYATVAGRSPRMRFPAEGPYDLRLGYAKLVQFNSDLEQDAYFPAAQARLSARLAQFVDWGVFPIYREKTKAGLRILDRNDLPVYEALRPQRVFAEFEGIPSLVVSSLLFIENREILDEKYPYRNPAVEWDRLGKALIEKAVQEIYDEGSAPGGSTIATQLEKYRHSPGGRTRTPKDKLQQMLSASLRAYLSGPETLQVRKQIVLDYINSIPLAALPGYGEVSGLGDGLWAWYGRDFEEVQRLLSAAATSPVSDESALAYKQVLSLFISHRRPSEFLLSDVSILNALTDEHLDLLTRAGVIPEELSEKAKSLSLKLQTSAPPAKPVSFLARKGINAIRAKLLKTLRLKQFYDLDQLDLNVHSTLDEQAQQRVTEALESLKDRKVAEEFGLTGERTLDRGDPAKVIYSLTLYEQLRGQNLLRIQTDNFDNPFDINEGAKLDLGSTAKLRTLANYLDLIHQLYEEFQPQSKERLREIRKEYSDPLTLWVLDYLLNNTSTSAEAVLEAAMQRTYSASPGESFFTGGGLHTFENFKKEDNGRIVTVQEAIRNSINLPFIRLMRDLVRYYVSRVPGAEGSKLNLANEEARQKHLAKFADNEGSYFLRSFYKKYDDLSSAERVEAFLNERNWSPSRLAVVFRFVYPNKDFADFQNFIQANLPRSTLAEGTLKKLYESYPPNKFNLQDSGYLARVHPLELWLLRFLLEHPEGKLDDVLKNSVEQRQEVYQWLIKSKFRHAQDIRIKVLIEAEAFSAMHRQWKKLAYPFEYLVPSYATAIGSSGDRPAALAELVGIIQNGGLRLPSSRISGLDFAVGTPYESRYRRVSQKPERVLSPEVAARLKRAIWDVVENGTARRVFGAFKDADGKVLSIGGKTGTGDHRYESYGKGGQLINSRVVSRTATFAFIIGERFFGVVTAHVFGEQAAQYKFTSALAAGLLKALAPAIEPVLRNLPAYSDSELIEALNGPRLYTALTADQKSFVEQWLEEASLSRRTKVVLSEFNVGNKGKPKVGSK